MYHRNGYSHTTEGCLQKFQMVLHLVPLTTVGSTEYAVLLAATGGGESARSLSGASTALRVCLSLWMAPVGVG